MGAANTPIHTHSNGAISQAQRRVRRSTVLRALRSLRQVRSLRFVAGGCEQRSRHSCTSQQCVRGVVPTGPPTVDTATVAGHPRTQRPLDTATASVTHDTDNTATMVRYATHSTNQRSTQPSRETAQRARQRQGLHIPQSREYHLARSSHCRTATSAPTPTPTPHPGTR